MIIAFIAFGVVIGTGAAGFTILAGGSLLLAFAFYCGAGALGAVFCLVALLMFSERQTSRSNELASSAHESRISV